jgi:hypothetical protein
MTFLIKKFTIISITISIIIIVKNLKDRTNLPLALSLVNHRIVVEDHYYSPDNKNRWKAIVYGLLWFNTIIIIRNYEKFAANFKYKIKKKHGM